MTFQQGRETSTCHHGIFPGLHLGWFLQYYSHGLWRSDFVTSCTIILQPPFLGIHVLVRIVSFKLYSLCHMLKAQQVFDNSRVDALFPSWAGMMWESTESSLEVISSLSKCHLTNPWCFSMGCQDQTEGMVYFYDLPPPESKLDRSLAMWFDLCLVQHCVINLMFQQLKNVIIWETGKKIHIKYRVQKCKGNLSAHFQ